jgi:hypothetical protein
VDSERGVRVGRYIRVGKTASSKTDPRPVWASMVGAREGKKTVMVTRPRRRWGVVGESRRVRRGGMKRGQEEVMISFWGGVVSQIFYSSDEMNYRRSGLTSEFSTAH